MIKKIKNVNYNHYFCLIITIGFVLCSIFLFPNAIFRLLESCRDFGLAAAGYFCNLFGFENLITQTVNDLPGIPVFGDAPSTPGLPILPDISFPETATQFKSQWSLFWNNFADVKNLIGYINFLGTLLYNITFVVSLIVPLFILFRILFKKYIAHINTNYDIDSKPLIVFKSLSKMTYKPLKRLIAGLFGFCLSHRVYLMLWLFMWLFNLNVFTIGIEFFAFYFYFSFTFDLASIYMQLYKLMLDLAVLNFVPVFVWIIVGLLVFDFLRKKIGYSRLNHFERTNRGFINMLSIVIMIIGSMGKGKTTLLTDMVLSQTVMYREKAYNMLLENDLKFPFFPWINLEQELKKAFTSHIIYNLATCKTWVKAKATIWNENKCNEKIFNYDYKRYGLIYDDDLSISHIWDVIEVYSQLYFLYVVKSSLSISNYSIRSDNVMLDNGNLPLFNSDFFFKKSKDSKKNSKYAHVLDFDALRLGKKMLKNNAKKNFFEFGVVSITEIGKERGNTLELKDIKKDSPEANQKNDDFNRWVKMVRHSATIDNFPFVKVLVDEQRPESWGADARDLCTIVSIKDKSDKKLAMPGFIFEEILYDCVFSRFINLYSKYRFYRGDNTLLLYLMKGVVSKINTYYNCIYNRFSYSTLSLQTESGTQDGKISEHKYFLMTKKIYSNRFSTDCFSDFFTEKALNSAVGLADVPEFQTLKASLWELSEEHSYFMQDLHDIKIDEESDNAR